jgi:hypothetical protein
VAQAIESPCLRWQAAMQALALHREEVAREQIAKLEELTAAGALRTGYYLELARAGLDLAQAKPDTAASRAAAAIAVFERALADDRVRQDGYTGGYSPAGRILAAELRAVRVTGDREAEQKLLRRIVDRRMLRAVDPIVWRRAQLDLAAREIEAGDAAPARALLDDVLGSWGVNAPELPEVVRARKLRAQAEGG